MREYTWYSNPICKVATLAGEGACAIIPHLSIIFGFLMAKMQLAWLEAIVILRLGNVLIVVLLYDMITWHDIENFCDDQLTN